MISPSLRQAALAAAAIAALSSSSFANSDAAFVTALGQFPAGLETISTLKSSPQMPLWTAAFPAGHPEVFRTNTGLRYNIPAGWEWISHSGNGVSIQHVATKTGAESPNRFYVGVTPTFGDDYNQGWDRIDLNERRSYPSGVTARWRSGPRFGGHYAFVGEATIGSKALNVDILTSNPPRVDVYLVAAAFEFIVSTLRDVPASATVYHPSLGIAAEPLPAQFWFPNSTVKSIKFNCWNNGRNGSGKIYVYPSYGNFADTEAVRADIANFHAKNSGLTLGAVQSAAIPGGEVLWTEQPGSQFPYLGAVRRDGLYYFLAVDAKPGSCTQDPSLADFMALAKSVRAWDGN